MNRKSAHLFIPLVQALANGNTLQYQVGEEWYDLDEDEFDFNYFPEEYRIKPEPRTFEVWLSKRGYMYPLEAFPFPQPDIERITVREVLA